MTNTNIYLTEEKNGYNQAEVNDYIGKLSAAYQEAYEQYRDICGRYSSLSEDRKMALKSLGELSREFIIERASRYRKERDERLKQEGKKRAKVKAAHPKKPRTLLISDILFYSAILVILFSALPSSDGGAPRSIMGYSYFTVLTSSMQDEIPKGSFILVRRTDPQNLRTGDNITYMLDWNTSVTHKIVNIYENYENSGARGFQTKGINNASPDKEIVYAKNIAGKVILVLPAAGAAISYLGANIYILFIFFGLCVIFSFAFRLLPYR